VSDGAIDRVAFERLVEMTGGDLEFVDDLIDTYLDDGAQQVELLREAAARGSVEDLVRPAHTLKSSSLNVGAVSLGELARTLEEAGRRGDVPHPPEWAARIAAGFEAAREELLAERAARPGA
jgi:HPt (histidine-containing phosphotransfer) domain-containing protein